MLKPQRKLLEQDQRLIERYVRLRMHGRAIRVSRFIMRRILPFQERERDRALRGAISSVAKQTSISRRKKFESSAVLFNLALFFLIAERDLQAMKIDALTHPDAWKRSLCARVILLTIHELDLDKVAGGGLRQALQDAQVSEEASRRMTDGLRAVRRAQQKAQKQFSFLRNATIAHRDPDALLQYRSITQLNERDVVRIAGEFYDGTRLFLTALPEVVRAVGTMPGLFRQLMLRAGTARNRSD